MRAKSRSLDVFELDRDGTPAVGLRFAFDKAVIATLKSSLRYQWKGGAPVGGWMPELRAWWVGGSVWPEVSADLAGIGCTFRDRHAPGSIPDNLADAGELLGWPTLRVSPTLSIPAGEDAWRRFTVLAMPERIDLATAAALRLIPSSARLG